MILKIFDHKTNKEKDYKDIKTDDVVLIRCDKCGKESARKFRTTRIIPKICRHCLLKDVEYIKETSDKRKQTCFKKYGFDSPMKSEKIKKRYKKTFLKKYGFDNPYKVTSICKRAQKNSHQTCLTRYGVSCTLNLKEVKEKARQTLIKNYGVDNPSKSKIIEKKKINTKRENGTFNTSKPEKQLYKFLKRKYKKVELQYLDGRYPFRCDFYIPEKDLFIEFQGSWTHGKESFNPNKFDHLEKLSKWSNKQKVHSYYKQAIKTWTIRDPLKRETAKNNNLNYLEFFALNEAKDYLNEFYSSE